MARKMKRCLYGITMKELVSILSREKQIKSCMKNTGLLFLFHYSFITYIVSSLIPCLFLSATTFALFYLAKKKKNCFKKYLFMLILVISSLFSIDRVNKKNSRRCSDQRIVFLYKHTLSLDCFSFHFTYSL